MIIGVAGKMGSGKDEAFKQMLAYGLDVTQCSFAMRLKQMVNRAWSIPTADAIAKPKYVRDLYQKVGTELFRLQVDQNFWVDQLHKDILSTHPERIDSKKSHIVITDVRFGNEAEYVRSHKGFVVKIIRPEGNDVAAAATEAQAAHASEVELDSIVPNFEVINDGTKEKLGGKMVYCLDIFLAEKAIRV